MKNLLLKSHVTVYLQLLARSITILKMGDLQGAFCKQYQKWAKASNKTGEMLVTELFHNWKKAVAKNERT